MSGSRGRRAGVAHDNRTRRGRCAVLVGDVVLDGVRSRDGCVKADARDGDAVEFEMDPELLIRECRSGNRRAQVDVTVVERNERWVIPEDRNGREAAGSA